LVATERLILERRLPLCCFVGVANKVLFEDILEEDAGDRDIICLEKGEKEKK
jgi:hypothetical protein